jgi:wyosine [tRNA(Phe)-imidazoG37] synthetase (radical SAM superfamily)
MVSPSLDAVSQEVFERLNRPHADLRAADLVEALVALRAEHPGQIWLEVLLVHGLNDTDRELDLLAEAIARIDPDRVQVNTAVRPGTEPDVTAASEEALRRALDRFGPRAEAIATFQADAASRAGASADHAGIVLAVVRRRPETVAALARALGIDEPTLTRCIAGLRADGRVRIEQRGDHAYVIATERAGA